LQALKWSPKCIFDSTDPSGLKNLSGVWMSLSESTDARPVHGDVGREGRRDGCGVGMLHVGSSNTGDDVYDTLGLHRL
jgi:hypothetical protein